MESIDFCDVYFVSHVFYLIVQLYNDSKQINPNFIHIVRNYLCHAVHIFRVGKTHKFLKYFSGKSNM